MGDFTGVYKKYQWFGPRWSKYFWTAIIDLLDVFGSVVIIGIIAALIMMGPVGWGAATLMAVFVKIFDVLQMLIAHKIFTNKIFPFVTIDWFLMDPIANIVPGYTATLLASEFAGTLKKVGIKVSR